MDEMIERTKLLNDLKVLENLRGIYLKDVEEDFKFQRTLTTLDCWIEDIVIELEKFEGVEI